jgi:endoglucanase
MMATAEAEGIPVQVSSAGARDGHGRECDAALARRDGDGLLSVPLRYMHTPNELLALEDLENTARLLAAFCARLKRGQDFTP